MPVPNRLLAGRFLVNSRQRQGDLNEFFSVLGAWHLCHLNVLFRKKPQMTPKRIRPQVPWCQCFTAYAAGQTIGWNTEISP